MKKAKLPDNWICVQSKSHPNQHYYFNTKTNKSSWIPPKITADEPSTKMSKTSRKRRNEEDNPTTPDNNQGSANPERPKLKARRSLPSKANKNSQETNNSNETPQMKVLRQKILEKQLAKLNNSLKKKGTIAQTESKSSRKIDTSEKKQIKKNDTPVQSMTPEMKVFYDRLQAKKCLAKVTRSKKSTKDAPKIEADEKPEVLTRDRSRAKSMGPGQIESEAAFSANRRRTIHISSVKSIRKKSESNGKRSPKSYNENKLSDLQRKPITPQHTKNIAQDRLAKLKKSLTTENMQEDYSEVQKIERSREKRRESEVLPKGVSASSIYKNAESRLQALTERLQSETKKIYDKCRNSIISTDEPDAPAECSSPSSDSFSEAMDWEPIADERIMHEIQIVRNELYSDIPEIQMQELPEENGLDLVDGQVGINRRALYIVIDTNVFLSNIQAVEEARDSIFKTHDRPILVIPWTVIRELDYIKDDRSNSRPASLKAKARQAVRFLHQHFSARHPRVLGQTMRDVINNRDLFAIECPDDEILQTCLQIQKSNNSVVLLSYDKNLCNKAMVHDIATLGRHDPLEKIDYLIASEYKQRSLLMSHLNENGDNPQSPKSVLTKELLIAENLYEKIKTTLKDFLTVIVAKEMRNLYGENWERYTIVPPPWTAVTVLKCAIKHWMGAVNDAFISRADSKLNELYELIIKHELNRRLQDVGHVIDLTYDLVQCLVVKKYTNLIENIVSSIEEIKKMYVEAAEDLQEEHMKEQLGHEGNQKELEAAAEAVFRRFEAIYAFARDICGAACESIGMTCSFNYRKLEPPPTDDFVVNLQPEIAGNLNRLLLILSTALEDLKVLHKDHRSVLALYHALDNFCPDIDMGKEEFSPIDVYMCLKIKEPNLRLGVPQLQELSDHFCRLAAFRCR